MNPLVRQIQASGSAAADQGEPARLALDARRLGALRLRRLRGIHNRHRRPFWQSCIAFENYNAIQDVTRNDHIAIVSPAAGEIKCGMDFEIRAMSYPEPNITVNVDVTNPGQFFACCGLLELADRLWPGAEGWFADRDQAFLISAGGTLDSLVDAVASAELTHTRPSDPYSSPLIIGAPFRPLMIDWWETDRTGARDLKVWAGTMESFGIAQAMQHAMRNRRFRDSGLFDVGMVVTTPQDAGKKKEPYYFDARRTPNAHSRDVGFSPNDLGITSIAHPAVELLCLIGLQVARPVLTRKSRVYDYFSWNIPMLPNLLLAASTGSLTLPDARAYRFENWFRTGQKKHKAFRSATPLAQGI